MNTTKKWIPSAQFVLKLQKILGLNRGKVVNIIKQLNQQASMANPPIDLTTVPEASLLSLIEQTYTRLKSGNIPPIPPRPQTNNNPT